MPRRTKVQFGDRVYLQTWEWSEDAKFYDMNLFVLKNTGEDWRAKPITTRMRVYKRAEVIKALQEAGLRDVEWYLPNDFGYYQSIVNAKG